MRNKLLALFLLPILVLAGCSTVQCFLKDKLATGFTEVVVDNAQCDNPSVVYDRNVKLIEGFGLCKPQTGPLASAVCRPVVDAIVNKVVTAGLDATYPGAGCHGTVAKQAFSDALTNFCVQLPVKYCPQK
jgi:hypothetical protein